MKVIWFPPCVTSYVLASCMKLLKRVKRRISRGVLPAYEALYSSSGKHFVRELWILLCKNVTSDIVIATEHHNKEEEKGKEKSPAWQGNRNRTLWKKTCAKAALNVCSS